MAQTDLKYLVTNAIKNNTACFLICDKDFNIIFANSAFKSFFEITEIELAGKDISFLLSQSLSGEQLSSIKLNTFNRGWHGNLKTIKSNDEVIPVELLTSVIKDGKDNPAAVFVTIRPLQVDEKNNAFNEFAYKVIESLPYPFFVIDKSSDVKIANPSACTVIFSSDKKYILLNSIIKSRVIDEVLVTGDSLILEECVSDLHEEETYFEIFASPIKDEDGNIEHIIISLKDITNKKLEEKETGRLIEEINLSRDQVEQNAEELAVLNLKLEDSEEKLKELNASKNKFFSIISHDLRSPFASLIGYTELLLNDAQLLSTEDIKMYAATINNAAQSLLGLVNDLLSWTRIETGSMEFAPQSIELSEVTTEICNLLKGIIQSKAITVNNFMPPVVIVYADTHMVISVLQNLISNAIKFTPEGGEIKIEYGGNDDFAEVSVTDTGVGISEANIEKLFKIGTSVTTRGTNDEKGTGLGLILCKELLEKNNGRIWVESKMGNGSRFTFALPRTKDVFTAFSKKSE